MDHGEEPQPTAPGRVPSQRVPAGPPEGHPAGHGELPHPTQAAVQVCHMHKHTEVLVCL